MTHALASTPTTTVPAEAQATSRSTRDTGIERIQSLVLWFSGIVGVSAITLGASILLDPRLTASALFGVRTWLQQNFLRMAEIGRPYMGHLGLLLLAGGTLLVMGASLAAVLLRRHANAGRGTTPSQ